MPTSTPRPWMGEAYDEFVEAVAIPQRLAGERIEGAGLLRESVDEFVAVAGAHNDGRGERADHAVFLLPLETVRAGAGDDGGFGIFPQGFAGVFVETDQSGVEAGAEVENAQIAVNERRSGVGPFVLVLAEVAVPQLLAVHVPAEQAGRSEEGDDAGAVGDGRRGAVGVFVVALLRLFPSRALFPELLAGGAIEANQGAAAFGLE